jgi:hypothetical protein
MIPYFFFVAVMVAEVKVRLLVNQSKFLDVAVMDVYCLKKKDDKFIIKCNTI